MMKSTSRTTRAAYTLVEIIIVILVMAIAAAIVIPNIGSAANNQALSAAQTLQSDLEVARSMAVTTQQPYSLVFSDDLQSYKVVANYAGGPYLAAAAINHPVNSGQLFQVHLGSLNGMSGVTVANVSFGGTPQYVTFGSLGDPIAPGTVVIQSGATQFTVMVESLTGIITVARTAG
jgi:prepilin-type N-terminal cleavage/methylation domain-containing protein